MRETCPKCGKDLVLAAGNPKSKILLVGEYPGSAEIMQGVPFVGESGKILAAELMRVGIQLAQCRATNLWQHVKNECDLDWHKNQMTREFKGRQWVLLMGSEVSKVLFDKGVMELSGIEMKHKLFPHVRMMVSPNPAQLLHGSVGEFRLALQRFREMMG